MIDDFPGFVRVAERRSRLIRSGSAAAFALLVSGSLYLAATLVSRAHAVSIPPGAIVAGAVFPLLASGAVMIVAFRRRIEPAALLLRLDLALGLPARLSSLAELEGGGSPAIRRRIEAAAAPRLEGWKDGLPIPKWTIFGLAIGFSFVVAGLLFSIRPVPVGTPGVIAPITLPSPSPPVSRAGDETSEPPAPPLPAEAAAEAATTGPEAGYTLSDILSELRISIGPSGAERPASEADLTDLLARIKERLAAEGGLLTDAERAELIAAMATVPPPLTEGINGILTEESPEALGNSIDQLLEEVGSAAVSLTSGGTEGATSPSRSEGEEEGGVGSVGMPEREETGGIPSASPATNEEGRNVPGNGGEGEEEEAPSPPLAEGGTEELLPTPVPGRIGEEGRLDLLLTAGVPIEYGTGSEGGGSISVSFERIDSILSERALSPSAVEAVRKYFETITGGGS